MCRTKLSILSIVGAITTITGAVTNSAIACTGITLKAKDGSVMYGRTMEWGTFDLHSRLMVIPRGIAFTGSTPDGKPGMAWKSVHGVVAVDGVEKDIALDGMNEKGLAVGLFYHPGFAEDQAYDPALAAQTVGPTDLGTLVLTTCATVEEARAALAKVRVVPVVESSLGFAPGVHYIITDPTGKAIVVEYTKGVQTIYDAPLGVLTNAPNYDWHETNLRNYVNLSPVAAASKKIGTEDLSALGGGSGMIGLPGDFTPPSRFVRAVAFSKSARPTDTGPETMYELFRILDNFNVPLGSAESGGDAKTQGMRSATLWTTAHDTKGRVTYFHTAHNRRVRKVDLNQIDFAAMKAITHMPLDKDRAQDIEDMTPKANR